MRGYTYLHLYFTYFTSLSKVAIIVGEKEFILIHFSLMSNEAQHLFIDN